jgi:kynurenine formamidase
MPGTNWGRWGADDERGALNLLTPGVVKRAATSIRTGRVYSLGIAIQGRGVSLFDFRGTPMRLTLEDATDAGVYAGFGCQVGTGAHEDVLVMASHTTSHMDALVHVYEDFHHYNGVPHTEMRAMSGAGRLGIEKVEGFAARAVLLDMPLFYGDEAGWVDHDRTISAEDLQGAAEREGVEVQAGDVVLIRTGYLQWWWANQPNPQSQGQAGIGQDAARWLAERDVIVVGGDNAAVEVIPFDDNDFLNVHKILLVQHGIYLLEFLDLSAPAGDGAYAGLLLVGPLKVTGATGSPINPIYIS